MPAVHMLCMYYSTLTWSWLFVCTTDAAEGDVVVLTKPLGIQLDINLNEWIHNLEVLNSHLAWIVGHIITSSNTTHIVNDFTII